jgi:hypothetical protein
MVFGGFDMMVRRMATRDSGARAFGAFLAGIVFLALSPSSCGNSVGESPDLRMRDAGGGNSGSGSGGVAGSSGLGGGGSAADGGSSATGGSQSGEGGSDGGAGAGGSNGGAGGSKGGAAGASGSSEAGAPGGDGGDSSAGMGGDAGAGGAPDPDSRCDTSMPFGSPRRVAGLMDGVARARFSADELTAWLSVRTNASFTGSSSEWHIATATRANRDAAFGDVSFPNSLFLLGRNDLSPSPTRDGLTLFMESFVHGLWEIRFSRRGMPSDPFPSPSEFPETVDGDGGPYVLPDGQAVYFHGNPDGESDIFRVDHSGGVFGVPEAVPGIDTDYYWESFPVVTEDELTIYFAGFGITLNPLDLWVASRTSRSLPFDNVQALDEFNTEADEIPTWVSPDGCRLYFERALGPQWDSTNAIFVVERVRP